MLTYGRVASKVHEPQAEALDVARHCHDEREQTVKITHELGQREFR